MTEAVTCPKCEKISGDDWSQCDGICPMPMSPHYTKEAEMGLYSDLSSIPRTPMGDDFREMMKGRAYGYDALTQAWSWFRAGWNRGHHAGFMERDSQ